jgi:hypothetical protein
MKDLLLTHPLDGENDRAVWKMNNKGLFRGKSMYKKLAKVWVNRNFEHLWK